MVAKISVGSSLYGAIAYNGEKINEAQGRLLTTNRIYNDGSGTVDIGKAMEGFLTFLPPQMKIEKPVVHISLNPHPEDVLTDIELQNIAREYLEKLGFGNQPYLVFKHEDIDRHHLHIVTVNVDENGKRLNRDFLYRRSDRIRRELEQKYGCKYSINSLVYWVTYVHNVVYSFYRSMIYCYINSTQRCAGSIVIDIIPTNGADKRKFFPFAPYFPVTNVIKRYFYPYFPAIIGIKGYSFPYFPYLSGIMKIKTALYSLFSRLDWHKTVVFPCLGEIYEGIRSLSWEIPVT